jgi:peptidyl-prolyl cis-trans isomerase SurA
VRTLPNNRFLLAVTVLALSSLGTVAFGALAKPPAAKPQAQAQQPGAPGMAGAAPPKPSDYSDSDASDNGVVAVINDQIVSEYDLRQRLALVLSTSGMAPTADNKKKMRPQVLETLKTEKLELEEAQRKNITVSPPEVDKEIEGILKDNSLTMDQLKAVMARSGVAMETLRGQIAVQLAWQKAIEDEYGDRINITDQDVSDEMARVLEGKDKPHYLVAEIFLPVDSPEQDTTVLKSANDLIAQMQNGAPFPTIARQFSQSPTAAGGGDLGWVVDGQLSGDLNDALSKISVGGLSPPIRAAGGYYILAVRDKQEGANAVLPEPVKAAPQKPGYLPIARILLPLPPKAPKEYIEKVMAMGGEIRAHIQSCAQAQKMVASVNRGIVFQNLGEMKLSDLSEQIQTELGKTQSGEPTEPFLSPAGVEVFARCDAAAPKALSKYNPPKRDEVERRLFQQQISMLARRYIRDLRRQGNVETR